MFDGIRWSYEFLKIKGWGIGLDLEWIGRCNGDCVAVRGVNSMDGCGRNGVGHGGLTWHGIQ